MVALVLRSSKGSPLTNAEVDNNFLVLDAGITAALLSAAWASISGKPTTLAGYGITDALSSSGGSVSGDLSVSGSIGIGGTATQKLTVTGGSIAIDNAQYLYSKTSTGTTTRLIGLNSSNTLYVGSIDAAHSGTLFVNGGVTQAQLASNGRFVIGSTAFNAGLLGVGMTANSTVAQYLTTIDSPTSLGYASLASGIRLGLGNVSADLRSIYYGTIFDVGLSISVANGNVGTLRVIDITKDGDVVIGTGSGATALGAKLQLHGNGGLLLTGGSGAPGDNKVGRVRAIAGVIQPYSGGLAFDYFDYDGSTDYVLKEGMVLNGVGNVGVGVTNPSVKLHVQGTPSSTYFDVARFETTTSGPVNITFSDSGTTAARPTIGGNGNALVFGTGAGTKMLLDLDGNVLIGTTSSDTVNKLQVAGRIGATGFANTNGSYPALSASILQGYPSFGFSHNLIVENAANNSYGWALHTTSLGVQTEKLRVTSTGDVILGPGGGSSARLQVKGEGPSAFAAIFDKSSAAAAAVGLSSPTDGPVAIFYKAWGGGGVGSITVTDTSVSYNTYSDYRLKDTIVPIANALETVGKLNPVTYNWKINGNEGEGFIAHELAKVVPLAVTGEKDATRIERYELEPEKPAVLDEQGQEIEPMVPAVMDEREVPVYQAIDTSRLVGLLTAAIKELNVKVDSLQSEVLQLKTPVKKD